jgi:hypothetical protein
VAVEAANMGARLETAGTDLDLADLLAAATAREAGATFVTANVNDFDKTPIHQLWTSMSFRTPEGVWVLGPHVDNYDLFTPRSRPRGTA